MSGRWIGPVAGALLVVAAAAEDLQPEREAAMGAERNEAGGEATALSGLSLAEAEARFGPPAEAEEILLDGNVSEFRIELLNHLDRAALAAAPERLLEATWSFGPAENVTAWYRREDGRWAFLHAMRWAPGDEF
ncbi:hypothetical protein LNKW23_25040 [Paralimibaculum aggregatum]|uniref:DUF4440 domain-containing protein n=1 Tax=Paralimibaculum aggregatum TaxID=3036245 RepID=A0ABQ6LLH5_9RHOB|nr:hypothetical protein [Limibaculum sp. NKW23]GMG83291.1 hypothetical protein LNKW23_25040 [Limibaculum sp. NKW23]